MGLSSQRRGIRLRDCVNDLAYHRLTAKETPNSRLTTSVHTQVVSREQTRQYKWVSHCELAYLFGVADLTIDWLSEVVLMQAVALWMHVGIQRELAARFHGSCLSYRGPRLLYDIANVLPPKKCHIQFWAKVLDSLNQCQLLAHQQNDRLPRHHRRGLCSPSF